MTVFVIGLICKHYSNISGDGKASPKGTEYGGLDAFPERWMVLSAIMILTYQVTIRLTGCGWWWNIKMNPLTLIKANLDVHYDNTQNSRKIPNQQ